MYAHSTSNYDEYLAKIGTHLAYDQKSGKHKSEWADMQNKVTSPKFRRPIRRMPSC